MGAPGLAFETWVHPWRPHIVARWDVAGCLPSYFQTVQYQKLTPMLLNELQKEPRQLEAQQKTIETLDSASPR